MQQSITSTFIRVFPHSIFPSPAYLCVCVREIWCRTLWPSNREIYREWQRSKHFVDTSIHPIEFSIKWCISAPALQRNAYTYIHTYIYIYIYLSTNYKYFPYTLASWFSLPASILWRIFMIGKKNLMRSVVEWVLWHFFRIFPNFFPFAG